MTPSELDALERDLEAVTDDEPASSVWGPVLYALIQERRSVAAKSDGAGVVGPAQ